MNMKAAARGLPLLALVIPLGSAADEKPFDLSLAETGDWECEACPQDTGWFGEAGAGLGNVSESSAKFGEYNGLDDDGLFLIGDGFVQWRGEEGRFLDLSADSLGLDSRKVRAEGGERGSYSTFVEYQGIPHNLSDSAETPFRGVGTGRLTLPGGWTRAGSPAGMTDLDNSLRPVDIGVDRTRAAAGARWFQSTAWDYAIEVQREEREGTLPLGGSFLTRTALLPEPVEYTTDRFEARAAYQGDDFNASFGYYGSVFRNDYDALTWDNPYTPLLAGAEQGQMALPPDNDFHQLTFTGNYRINSDTRTVFMASAGRGRQNESFLRPTVNDQLDPGALPRGSLDGEVDTRNLMGRLTYRPWSPLRLKAEFRWNERDNSTPVDAWPIVATDVFSKGTRSNYPYSHEGRESKVQGKWRIDDSVRVGFGAARDTTERTFQQVERTDEDRTWVGLNASVGATVDVGFRYEESDRDGEAFQTLDQLSAPENPLLVKFYMADRSREESRLNVTAMPAEWMSFGVTLEQANNDYTNSSVGLQEDETLGVSIDWSATVAEDVRIHGLYSRHEIEYRQTGSQSFSTPDWRATNNDLMRSVTLGLALDRITDDWSGGLDLAYSYASGETTVGTGATDSDFPDLTTRLASARLHADWQLSETYGLRFGWLYEDYHASDWALDGLDVDTASGLLSLGRTSPEYSVNVVMVSLRYRFD